MSRRMRRRIAIGLALISGGLAIAFRYEVVMKRVEVIQPGALVRGAWQRPWPLRRLIDREGIRTIVTLTAINRDDPKYIDQQKVVEATRVDWIIVPMRGSTATLDQLAETADLLADPARHPVFFHCVAGHHRTNLALAAYRIRHEGWSADRAWEELSRFPWTEPEAPSDQRDRRLIDAFAAEQGAREKELTDVLDSESDPEHPPAGDRVPDDRGPRGLAMDDRERRHR